MPYYTTFIHLFIFAVMGACQSTASATNGENELLKAIIVNNSSGKNTIHSYKALCDWSATIPSDLKYRADSESKGETDASEEVKSPNAGENVFSIATMEMKKKGSMRFVRKTEQQSTDAPDSLPRVRDFVGVVNDQYTAFSVAPNIIEQHFHASQSPASSRRKLMLEFLFNIELIEWAFDTTSGPVGFVLGGIEKADGWWLRAETVGESKGDFKILAFNNRYFGGSRPEREYTFQGAQGFILSRLRVHSYSDGHARISRDVEAQQLANGVWFPRRISLFKASTSCELTVRSAEVNCELSDDDFSLAALGMDHAGVTLIRYNTDGEKILHTFGDKGWIPVNVNELKPSRGN